MIWGGRPYDCIELAKRDRVVGITCAEILEEFEEKLTTKLNVSPSHTSEIVTNLLGFLRTVKITNQLKGITTDPDDDKVIECAVVAGATHIVTGDPETSTTSSKLSRHSYCQSRGPSRPIPIKVLHNRDLIACIRSGIISS